MTKKRSNNNMSPDLSGWHNNTTLEIYIIYIYHTISHVDFLTGDKNKARRDAVRRKTAQYLMKAEDLYNRHLASDTVDDKRWSVGILLK